MPFAELRVLSRREAKLLASLIPASFRGINPRNTINKKPEELLGALISLAERGIAQPERSQTVGFSNSRPLRRAQGVQSAKSQIVGFLKPRFHCTTLRVINRRMP
jgi:hypothetical protein